MDKYGMLTKIGECKYYFAWNSEYSYRANFTIDQGRNAVLTYEKAVEIVCNILNIKM